MSRRGDIVRLVVWFVVGGWAVGCDLRVTTDDVRAKAVTVQAQAAGLESQVVKWTSVMQALAGTSTGSASSAFRRMCGGWKGQACQIQAQTEQTGRPLISVGTNYGTVEAQKPRHWASRQSL